MGRLKLLSVLLAFTAATGMLFGTAGFIAVAADRGMQVNVVDDSEAFVAVEACQVPAADDAGEGNPVNVTVENRLTAPFDITSVQGLAGGEEVDPQDNRNAFKDPIGTGYSVEETLTFEKRLDDLRLVVETTDDSVTVQTDVTVELHEDCLAGDGDRGDDSGSDGDADQNESDDEDSDSEE